MISHGTISSTACCVAGRADRDERACSCTTSPLRVPRANLIPKPPQLSWEVAACLGTAWLTVYRMLFIRARVLPGETVLVHGAGGGVATALIQLATTAGIRVWVTSRDAVRRQRAVTELGTDNAFAPDALLPELVDAVMDTVGARTLESSLSALRAGGRLVLAEPAAARSPNSASAQYLCARCRSSAVRWAVPTTSVGSPTS
ncbi:zinc-binding dehydrogenase [Nocardia rhizosphaerihabitans]|uniref:zinc-binding dehydrogenase n=1 Tax=Nocardia rhizosphaerihabitans TaxID=1691570 RepID=UPI00366F07FE